MLVYEGIKSVYEYFKKIIEKNYVVNADKNSLNCS